METPQPLGTGYLRRGRAAPIDFGRTLKLQQVTGGEIHEQQRCPRLGDQIAEGVEIAVAAKIGDGQLIAVDPNEAGPPAAM